MGVTKATLERPHERKFVFLALYDGNPSRRIPVIQVICASLCPPFYRCHRMTERDRSILTINDVLTGGRTKTQLGPGDLSLLGRYIILYIYMHI